VSEPSVHLLLVEDNPGDARLLRETLRDAPSFAHRLSHEATLADGLARLARGGVDVLLLDLSLPDAHGLDTVARAAAAAPEVPIVVLTGLDDETTAVRALTAGAQDYLTKGMLDAPLLVRTLRYARERKRLERERERLLCLEQEARAAAEAAERRASFLAEASAELSSSLDSRAALERVCRMAAGRLAECCVVYLAEDDVGLVPSAAAHADPALEEDMWTVLRRHVRPGDPGTPGAEALRTGVAVQARVEPEPADGAPSLARLLRRLGARRYVAAPLVVRGEAIGLLVLVSAGPERDFAPAEVTLAAEVARRAALAVDNARLYEEAQRAVRARGEVLRVVSHDLGNALSAVAVNTTVLLRTLPQEAGWAEQARARLLAMRGLVEQLQRLRQDLLDAVAVDAGKLAVEPSRNDPWSILQQVIEEFAPLAAERSLALEMEAPQGLPEVWADRLRVLQVFGNLVGNATKFTPAGGRVTVGAEAAGEAVVFRVSDTGIGIAPDDLPHVFDRFWKTPQHNQMGVGLGLAITRGIVEAHGGEIRVESRPGEGTTFSFTMPVAD
jgi:signal transduction histidine kinase/DNA-binding NarL/FixJ family response regulator